MRMSATRGTASARASKPIEEDDKALLMAMGKQMKELHSSLKAEFDAWKKSELRSKDTQAELRQATDELRMANKELRSMKDELQTVHSDLQALKQKVEEESSKWKKRAASGRREQISWVQSRSWPQRRAAPV
ncbi:hypothetical protein LZ31DRAFT_559825 [Colletotrichum somersetense]|nr:hypothetical protein LZ31DRAFT_559825 [Colletotrichum somersetense]